MSDQLYEVKRFKASGVFVTKYGVEDGGEVRTKLTQEEAEHVAQRAAEDFPGCRVQVAPVGR